MLQWEHSGIKIARLSNYPVYRSMRPGKLAILPSTQPIIIGGHYHSPNFNVLIKADTLCVSNTIELISSSIMDRDPARVQDQFQETVVWLFE